MDNQSEKLISERIAKKLALDSRYVSEVISLLDGGDTIPFIARYRKEISGGMTDEQLRALVEMLTLNRNLESRRADIMRLLQVQGALAPELRDAVQKASSAGELEDLYRPYRPRKRTRAGVARERGLEPLAQFILRGEKDPQTVAHCFLDEEKGVPAITDALQGAKDILAEIMADDPKPRRGLRDLLWAEGIIAAKKHGPGSNTYEMYDDYREPCKKISSHRILAMNRGEKEGHLQVKVEISEERALPLLRKHYIGEALVEGARHHLEEAAGDSWRRLLFPSLEREIRTMLTQKAVEQALKIFRENLRSLLMVPPVCGKRILAIDPGLRTGCKIACVDERGKLLETAVIFPTPPRNEKDGSAKTILSLVEKHCLNAIVIGNGTGGRETELFIAGLLESYPGELAYTVVNEAGASVYSASELGQAEFPGLDAAERGAVSLARRVQDAMAELVKIDPRSIGVGQYQHDVNQKMLAESLGGVVESCVNEVGVDLNTASPALLEHVAGINKVVAANILAYREEKGPFSSRDDLKKVPRLGPAAFKQCAGFLRIPAAENYLDRSAVHPESYATARQLMDLLGLVPDDLGKADLGPGVGTGELATLLQVGEPTIRDILAEFKKPGRDPRDDLPPPVFKREILSPGDLTEGMVLEGVVRNVVDFGAFVDIGVHVDGLIHISQLSDRYVRHPLDVIKVGEIVSVRVLSIDLPKKRISLSLKKQ